MEKCEDKNIKLGDHWSGWFDLAHIAGKKVNLDLVKENLEKPGGYIIRIEGRKIHRFGGIDVLGIIDIGQSNHLWNRINQFHRCLGMQDRDKCGHMAGWRFRWLELSIDFSVEKLRVAWRNTKDNERPDDVEAKAMRCYINLFKELPPLNYKFNWSKDCGCDGTFVMN